MYKHFGKRVADILAGLAILFFFWWLILIACLAIYIEDPGPVFFRQRRLGLHGKEFVMLKLRSMKQNSEHTGSGVYSGKDDPRLLKTGKLFRKLSIDELPQAIHLISGKMSLIGPRPPLTYHPWPLAQYTEQQRHMFDVRPGITGWAQVNGRKGVEWHRRIELNCWYADNVSFLLDAKIFFMTIGKVFAAADNVNTEATLKPESQTAADTTESGTTESAENTDN